MTIEIEGAKQNNLKDISTTISDGLTVVTGISGSGKSSLVYDTIYHEARRRYLDIFAPASSRLRMRPAQVDSISGLYPSVAIDQNSINRNPQSTLATATGLHPFLRILYTNYGLRRCPSCLEQTHILTRDELIHLIQQNSTQPIELLSTLISEAYGSHSTLLEALTASYSGKLVVDGKRWDNSPLDPEETHTIQISHGPFIGSSSHKIEEIVDQIYVMNSSTVILRTGGQSLLYALYSVCPRCDRWFTELEPKHFHLKCLDCQGEGCEYCNQTGIYPEAAVVSWKGYTLHEFLSLSVEKATQIIVDHGLPGSADRLLYELRRRLEALMEVGLGYLSLDRSSPTLSRGEAQRVRLAVVLASRMENMLHILDEPTIGLSNFDTRSFLPALRKLKGPVLYVEHDRVATAIADEVIDLGPGAGRYGGEIVFQGNTTGLWQADTETGRYFSLNSKITLPNRHRKKNIENKLNFGGVKYRYLNGFDVSIPLGHLTVIAGVSGSGKSTFIEEVVQPSLDAQKPVGCESYQGSEIRVILVDQSPIGRNPRSNPATYTKLSDIIRDLYANASGLSKSHFSFNRPEGQCPECKGIGAEEYKLPYIAPVWLQCEDCGGTRFNNEVMQISIPDPEGNPVSIAQLYELTIQEAAEIILASEYLTDRDRKRAQKLLDAMIDIGLDYLTLGQASPTLSGGEAQRIKLTKYLGKQSITNALLILDEPTTGLHPADISGLLQILYRLIDTGATVVVVEHNMDVIRAADWLIELGPGAGMKGGYLIYQGPIDLTAPSSPTINALMHEDEILPESGKGKSRLSEAIEIKHARTNNLKDISLEIPKNGITVITGKSGSGKSSLVRGVLELEARRRFLESLSVYERQSTMEGAQADVESVSGLGVTVSPRTGEKSYAWRIDPRYTVGKAAELSADLYQLLVVLGEMICPQCGQVMVLDQEWECPGCEYRIDPFDPSYLSIDRLSGANMGFVRSACPKCKGIGRYQVSNKNKLIIDPTKPICAGAMYSPGFWPYGFYCKKYNGAYMILQGLAKVLDFDPATTPWNEMSQEAQHAFLYGYDEEIDYIYESRTIGPKPAKGYWQGPFREWGGLQFADHFGTYSDTVTCEECQGKKLKPDYLALKLQGNSVYQLEEMSLVDLQVLIRSLQEEIERLGPLHQRIYHRFMSCINYLNLAGLGYMNQNRLLYTLSAGEYERLKLAKMLGSGLSSLTILLDEPTKGLHASEVNNLIHILHDLRSQGNQIIIVEHDLDVIRAADYIVDMGPEGGVNGGKIVMQGPLSKIDPNQFPRSYTAQWLAGNKHSQFWRAPEKGKIVERRPYSKSIRITGARANNLKNIRVDIPLGIITGICGVSGSGKSSLIIDTLVRVVAPKKHTSSLAPEEIEPGEHDTISGVPKRVLYVDQSKTMVYSPWNFLGLKSILTKLFLDSEDADVLEISEQEYKQGCDACDGRGVISMDMGFLPTVHAPCDVCDSTGFSQEAFSVRLRGASLPQVVLMTIEEVYQKYHDLNKNLERKLRLAMDFGLGYVVLKQPVRSLSAGEVQRLRLVKEMSKKSRGRTLFIFDEPSVGMSAEDVDQLIRIFHRLVDNGHSVLLVEHQLHLLAACDWLIELGPVGGKEGGYVIAEGTPEDLALEHTPTAPYLRKVLEVQR